MKNARGSVYYFFMHPWTISRNTSVTNMPQRTILSFLSSWSSPRSTSGAPPQSKSTAIQSEYSSSFSCSSSSFSVSSGIAARCSGWTKSARLCSRTRSSISQKPCRTQTSLSRWCKSSYAVVFPQYFRFYWKQYFFAKIQNTMVSSLCSNMLDISRILIGNCFSICFYMEKYSWM